jgi:hypothetical protein
MGTLAPRWLVSSSIALLLAPVCACTLKIAEDPVKARLPSCEQGKVLFANPDGWGCVLPGGLGVTRVTEAAHAKSAGVVDHAPSADHATLAAVGAGLNPQARIALGFDGEPVASLDVRGGGIQVEGKPVPADLGRHFLSNLPPAVQPGSEAASSFPETFEVPRTGVLHLRAMGTVASTTAADGPLAAASLATCAIELSAVGPGNATDVHLLGWTAISAFQSSTDVLPASWYVEAEDSNATLTPGSYALQLKVRNVSSIVGAPCALQRAEALLSFY